MNIFKKIFSIGKREVKYSLEFWGDEVIVKREGVIVPSSFFPNKKESILLFRKGDIESSTYIEVVKIPLEKDKYIYPRRD